MRLVKMLGLAAVTAMTAMAIAGATPASAASTQLCNSHTALTCSSAATSVTWLGSILLLYNGWRIKCFHFRLLGTPLALANPQTVHVSELLLESCEVEGGEGDGCVITATELPLANLLKTGLDTGTLTFTNGVTLVVCEDVLFGVDMECTYDLTGFASSVGSQHLTINGGPLSEIGEGILCPTGGVEIDFLLETTANRYVLA